MISIVLPTYNGQQYLELAIRSIMTQTYCDWELIIIDDCSTDNTPMIAKHFANIDPRIKYHRNRKNLQLPASLNEGFSLSQGEYLTWTSDDNVLLPKALATMYEYMESNDVGLVFARQEIINQNGNVIGRSPAVEKIEDLFFKNIVGACFMYRRDVYEDVGAYDTNKFLVEDWDYWLRIYRKYPIGHIEAVLYQYRTHGASLTEHRNFEVQRMVSNYLEDILRKDVLTDYIKSNIYLELIKRYFSINSFDSMRTYYKKVRNEYPERLSEIGLKYRMANYLPNVIMKNCRNILRIFK